MVLFSEGVVPVPIIDAPELLLRVVRVCVEPLHAAELSQFMLELAVGFDEVVMLGGSVAPEADIEHELLGGVCICFNFI